MGIDLAGKDKNPTGICIIKENKTSVKIVYKDEEILNEIEKHKPDVICIDAPFDFPSSGFFRESDKLLISEGYKCLSPRFKGMQPLVIRAKKLVKLLKNRFTVIEVFPRATEHIFRLKPEKGANPHKYDALLCALTGKCYLNGNYRDLKGIIIPEK